MYGRFALMAGLFLGSFPMTSCDDDAVTTEYQPLPKLTLDEPFQYECTDANLVSFTPDSLTRVAVLNFLKEDVADLDYVDYDEQTCMFTFRKGELSHYRITWEYETSNAIKFLYTQNGMWYRMLSGDGYSYVLEAVDGMSVCVAVQPGMHPNDRNVSLTFHQFRIEDIGGTDETQARLR